MNTITEILEQENLIAFLIEVNDEDRILEKGLTEQKKKLADKARAKGLIQSWYDKEHYKYIELSQKGCVYLRTLPNYLPDYMSHVDSARHTAFSLGWVKEFKLLGVGPLLRLTPEGEAEIARYHRVSNNQYDMNRSEKIKC